MDAARTAAALAALGHATRLSAAHLLADAPDGLGAGEIGRRLGVRQNVMSAHLKTLAASGVATGQRNGREIIYRLEAFAMTELAAAMAELARNGRDA